MEHQFLRTNTSWEGPNTETDEKSAYDNCWLAGPQHRNWIYNFYRQCKVGVWAPTQRISKRNSTGNTGWGVGSTQKVEHQFLWAMLVGGAPTQKLTKSTYDNVRVGGAPTQRISKKFYGQYKLGDD